MIKICTLFIIAQKNAQHVLFLITVLRALMGITYQKESVLSSKPHVLITNMKYKGFAHNIVTKNAKHVLKQELIAYNVQISIRKMKKGNV